MVSTTMRTYSEQGKWGVNSKGRAWGPKSVVENSAYSADPPAFVEIAPYGKILKHSKVRNTIFFKTLFGHH
jgi:hypothetical protein